MAAYSQFDKTSIKRPTTVYNVK